MGSLRENILAGKTIVVKLGGSAITVKGEKPILRTSVIENIAEEISSVITSNNINLVLIHGAGSFGHPQAAKWVKLANRKSLVEISETKEYVERLDNIILRYLRLKNIPAFPLHPSTILRTVDEKLAYINLYPVLHLLLNGYIPLLHGDIVLDYSRGFAVVSGDTLARIIAISLKAKYLVYGMDVDGIFVNNKLIRKITTREISKLSVNKVGCKNIDVTGGILLKLKEAVRAASRGVKVVFVNITVKNRLKSVLQGYLEDIPCTVLSR
ncbi:MAG: hypothetical protein DRN04_06055 [Thermoprotei archaeon]|nr:MAG: hypothetical protein DRN04_06055 [Thermoprotei archaeon]